MNDEKPTIVLLHGVGLDHTMWDLVRHELPASAVFLDLPGHGDQPTLHTETSLQELADDIASRLPNGLVQLVGFSLGGLIAQRLAIDLPHKITSVVAASTVCQRSDEERAAVVQRLVTAQHDLGESTRRSLERWFPEDSAVSPEFVEQTRRVLERNDRDSFLYAYQVFATADQELATQLDQIRQPLLAITGELDRGSTPDMSQRLVEAVPHGTLRIIPGARHMLTHESPQAFAKYIQDHFSLEEVGEL